MAIENCLRGLEPDALVLAVQQLAQAFYSARGQLTQGSPDLFRDARPAARIGTEAREPVSAFVAFHCGSPFLGNAQILLRQTKQDVNPAGAGRPNSKHP
jgi:hypothetical protein